MIYLDSGATSLVKPEAVYRALARGIRTCANPGRGGHKPAMAAAKEVFACREKAGRLFHVPTERVAFTASCTHGLNIAVRTLVQPGDRVLISGFEHNAVTRPLYALKAETIAAGRKLFRWDNTLEEWEDGLKKGPKAAVFTCVSNVFGYILPYVQMAELCRAYSVPFVMDAAQAAGCLEVDMEALGADFIAMPGHKGLLGPQGTGLLLCGREPEPLLFGGTGSNSREPEMPEYLPDRLEAGTLNVPGICGLGAGLDYVARVGTEEIFAREAGEARRAARGLKKLGLPVYAGQHQSGVLSFVTKDCVQTAQDLGDMGICLRAGYHCAPLAHESAGTLETGTVRVSFGMDAGPGQTAALLRGISRLQKAGRI